MLKHFLTIGLLCGTLPTFCAAADDPKPESDKDKKPKVIVLQKHIELTDDQEDGEGKKVVVVVDSQVDTADTANDDDEEGNDKQLQPRRLRAKILGSLPAMTAESQITSASPKLWLGVALKSIEGDLATFLGSTEGALVDLVQPKSPAEKAGIKPGDIVLSVDGAAVNDTSDLLEILHSASEGKALKFQVQRKGEKVDVSATPQPRPQDDSDDSVELELAELADLDEGKSQLRWRQDFPGEGTYMFRFGDPAVINLVPGVELKGDLVIQVAQDNDGDKVEIKIARKSGQPAQITVKRGDKEETYSEEQLDQLPDDLRNWVKAVLGGQPASAMFGVETIDISGDDDDEQAAKSNSDIALQIRALANLKESKELKELLNSFSSKDGQARLQQMIEVIVKNSKSQAHEAVKQALEQAGLGAQQVRELYEQHAHEAQRAAHEWADLAKDQAREQVEIAAQKVDQHKGEIAALKALVDALRKEIADLRRSMKSK